MCKKLLKRKELLKILLPRIVAVFLLTGVGLGQARNCVTMIVTAFQLSSISHHITYIEELANTSLNGWSEKRVKEYDAAVEERNALINSSNHIVANFAKSNNLQRFIMFIFCIFVTLLLLCSAAMLVPTRYIKRLLYEE